MKLPAVLLAPIFVLAMAPSAAQSAPAKQASQPQTVGRLFFTPERRIALERQRLSKVRDAEPGEGATLSLDGVVARSSGKTTVWINGRPQNEADAANTGIAARVSRRKPGTAVVSAGDDAPALPMRVGDAVNLGTQERQGILGEGSVKVKPAAR